MTRLLTDEFLEKYKGKRPPMTELGEFVYYRTYSRWLEKEGRREYWYETVARAVEYVFSLEIKHKKEEGLDIDIESLRYEANLLFDRIFNLKQFTSGRTFWVGGTDVTKKFPSANYNCAFNIIQSFTDFAELFYLLMVGAGVGFRTMESDVEKIPSYRTDIELKLKEYKPVEKIFREDLTSLRINGNTAIIQVGDSKEGWVQSLDLYFKLLSDHLYRDVEKVKIVFDHVRPKGERLKTFGGTASGHESLKTMFEKIHKVMIDNAKGKLNPIDVVDICNIIGENVVVGGVRRTSEINLASKDDEKIDKAKNDIFDEDGNVDTNLTHRFMSNNAIFYESKPNREELHNNFINLKKTGERGFINAQALRKRRENGQGVNPCGEILLADKGMCNLTTVNVMGFVEDGKLNLRKLIDSVILSSRIGVRMTLVDLEIPSWNERQKKDRLIGCSLTGFYDMVDATGMSVKAQKELLNILRKATTDSANIFAERLGIPQPLLKTTIKPEGTLSQLPTVSSGLHRNHSKYYIRRVRINRHDALARTAKELGYPIKPEVGQTWDNATTLVIEFPVESPTKVTKYDVSAIEQLKTYKMFMEEYVDHNASITVTVRDHEWEEVEEWVWNNWDSFVGVSFLSLDDNVYQLAPYEAITEEEYNERKAKMKPLDIDMLNRYETGEDKDLSSAESCDSGICPIR